MNGDAGQHSGARCQVSRLATLFFFSGASALVYEVSWTRMFSVVCGGATHALTAVLAAYMGGLALGGFLGGRLSDRRLGRPVLAYGLLEGLIGASALALTLAIPHLPPILKALKLALGLGGGGLDAARFLLSAIVLLVPTTLMGATFPVLVRGALPRPERLGFTAAVLYAANALGAAAGALAGGFVLIPAFGFLGAVSAAAAADGAILIVVLAVPGLRGAAAPAPAAASPDQRRRGSSMVRWVWLLGYGVSGACAMAYQVGWARALSLSLGNSTYALSIILAAYIGGLALGGAVISPLADRWRGRMLVAGALEGVIGLAAILVMPLFEWLTARMFGWSLSLGGRFEAMQGARLAAAFGLIIVPTTAMGALLPLVVKGVGELRGGAGEPAGEVYAANTVGAIGGAALTGYFLLGRLGVEHTLLLAAGVSVGVGIVWMLGDGGGVKVRLAGALGLAAVAGVGLARLPRWDPILMNSGPYLYAGMFRGELRRGADVRDLLHDYCEVLFYEEGVETTASVLRLRLGGEL